MKMNEELLAYLIVTRIKRHVGRRIGSSSMGIGTSFSIGRLPIVELSFAMFTESQRSILKRKEEDSIGHDISLDESYTPWG